MINHQKSKKNEKDYDLLKLLIVLSMPCIALSIIQNGFLVLLPFVRDEFVLTRAQVGYYSTSFFASATALAVFTGSIVDKLGSRNSMLLGIGCMGFIVMLYGFSHSYTILLFLALIAGLGFSIITPSVTKGVLIAAPPEKRAISFGVTHMGFGFGGIAGASLLPILGENLGWRAAVQIAAFFALLTGLLVFKLYKLPKHNSISDNPEIQPEKTLSFKDNLISLFTNKPLFRICILGIIFGLSLGAGATHIAVFLSGDLKMSRVAAGLGVGILQFGGIISRPAWGWISDKLFKGDRRFSLFIIGLSIGLMYLIFGLFLNSPQIHPFTVYIFSFLLGCSALGWPGVHFVAVGEFAGDKQAGIATGLSLLFLRVGMLVAPPFFGFIADTRGNYQYGWLFFGTIILLASSLFLLRD